MGAGCCRTSVSLSLDLCVLRYAEQEAYCKEVGRAWGPAAVAPSLAGLPAAACAVHGEGGRACRGRPCCSGVIRTLCMLQQTERPRAARHGAAAGGTERHASLQFKGPETLQTPLSFCCRTA